MPDRETLSLVIVGHVDHGKSTLIGRLLHDTGSLSLERMEEVRRISRQLGQDVEYAYVMDHLEEERTDAMTIDTAQAFFRSRLRDYVIIDAPGHRELTKNMVTGASQAEAAILVVDAVEGMREQTQRHAYFLSMLGVDQVAVLVNKMDKVSYSREKFASLAEQVERFLRAVGVKPSHLIPGSAMKGDNIAARSEQMPWYSGATVLDALDTFKTAEAVVDKPLRFSVQDVYSVDGKRILMGRVEAGRVEAGQEVVFLPSGARVRVASVEVFGQERASAVAEESVGLTIDPPVSLDRGEVACSVGKLPGPTNRFRANVFWMAAIPCKAGERLGLRAATQEVACSVERIEKRIDSSSLNVIQSDAPELSETEVGRMILRADRPVVLEAFQDVPELGRIVLTRGVDVVAGGLVTHADDTHPG